MDMKAYHRAWLGGATEDEAIRAGDEACVEQRIHEAAERNAYAALEAEAYAALQRDVDAHCNNTPPASGEEGER